MQGKAPNSDLALFLPDLHGGGAERMMLTIARGLFEKGRRVHLILATARGAYLNEVPEGLNVIDLGARGVLASFPRLVRTLRELNPTAVLGTLPYANLVLLWAARAANPQIRVYLREASTPSGVLREYKDPRTRAVMELAKVFFRRANGVVAVSGGVANDVHAYLNVPTEKIHLIYNPVVTPQLAQLAREPVEHRFFRTPGPTIVSAGRLGAEKDFPTLIRAFHRLRALRPEFAEAKLLILGEGGERARLERLAAQLGLGDSIDLPGFVPNPLPYMAGASVYALSSAREGLPGSLIQAMACGTPVVSTDCPSGPSEVLDQGRYGPLVSVGDQEALASAIARALRSPLPPDRLIERAQHYSFERSINQYDSLLLGGSHAVAGEGLANPAGD